MAGQPLSSSLRTVAASKTEGHFELVSAYQQRHRLCHAPYRHHTTRREDGLRLLHPLHSHARVDLYEHLLSVELAIIEITALLLRTSRSSSAATITSNTKRTFDEAAGGTRSGHHNGILKLLP